MFEARVIPSAFFSLVFALPFHGSAFLVACDPWGHEASSIPLGRLRVQAKWNEIGSPIMFENLRRQKSSSHYATSAYKSRANTY